jgi:hypothetical protein
MIITLLRKPLEGCPVQRMDRQTGYGDEGGASRFFKQFKKEESNEP